MEPEQNEPGKKKIFIGIIVALLLIVCVSLYFTYSGNRDNMDITAEKAALDTNFKNLSDTLDVRNAQIDLITNRNIKLDSTVAASQTMIANEKKQISGLLAKNKMTKSELEEAKGMIAQYEVSISELQKEVVELSAQNQQLTQENGTLTDNLNSETKAASDLNAENKGLAERVEVGSLLQLKNIDVTGVKQKKNGKEIVVKDAKNAASIRVSFETGQNKMLLNGPLSLYVRVINPGGETMAATSQGSGVLQLAESNSQVQYSKKAQIDWNQTNKQVEIYWTQNISTAGIYKVEIYQTGYLIGKGQVKLN